MKATRRGFLGAIAGLAAVAAAPKAEAKAEVERTQQEILMSEVLAHPDRYPDIYEKARTYLTEQPTQDAYPLMESFNGGPMAIRNRPGAAVRLRELTRGDMWGTSSSLWFGATTGGFMPAMDLGGGGEHRTLLLERRIGKMADMT